jgi:hypothetical protein
VDWTIITAETLTGYYQNPGVTMVRVIRVGDGSYVTFPCVMIKTIKTRTVKIKISKAGRSPYMGMIRL